jgi:hypothetical protein
LQKEKVNIASNFLMGLSKPKNDQQPKDVKLNFDQKVFFKPKEKTVKKMEPTE